VVENVACREVLNYESATKSQTAQPGSYRAIEGANIKVTVEKKKRVMLQ
jgi:hypothetical protein